MPRVSPLQSNFNSGEISPLLYGRTPEDRYKAGLAICLNYIPTLQGALTRRPGTKYVTNVKDVTIKTRLIPFEFSLTQAYMLEFGDGYIRFYSNNAPILDDSNNIYEVSTPYSASEIFVLTYVQSADVIYLFHTERQPKKLERLGNANWVLVDLNIQDGPYLPIDSSNITLTPDAATGNTNLRTGPAVSITAMANNGSGRIRVTAAGHGLTTGNSIAIDGVVGTIEANNNNSTPSWTVTVISASTFDLNLANFINAYTSGGKIRPAMFTDDDVGKPMRLQEGSTWGWGIIFSITHAGAAFVQIHSTLTNTNAKTFWRMGIWGSAFPAVCTFHQDRLALSGHPDFPQRVDLSASGDYENFAPSELDGTVTDGSAISFTLNSTDVNAVKWLSSDEKGLLVGAQSKEWAVRPSSSSEALTPTNINAAASTSYGSLSAQAVQSGKSTLFIQRSGRKLRELNYYFEVDGFRAADLTELSEHITGSGIVSLAAQKESQPLVWAVRQDGLLTCMTYDRNDTTLRVGWSRQLLGGQSDTGGSPPEVESIAVIPSPDGTFDQLWMTVKRSLNGQSVRTVECMESFFNDLDEPDDAYHFDCGATFDNPLSISAITKANPAVVTSTAHGLVDGDKIRISDIIGMRNLNDQFFLVANKTDDTFQITDLNGNVIDSTLFIPYVSAGNVWKFISTVSGLTWLANETVSVLADGAVHPPAVVSNAGVLSLNFPATIVSMGFDYNSDGQMLRIDAGSAEGTSIGKKRRANRVAFMLHRIGGLKIGMAFNDLREVTFRKASAALGRSVPLFSGIISEQLLAEDDFDNQICFRQNSGLPGVIQSIAPQFTEQDG